MFQFTHPGGVRPFAKKVLYLCDMVSIHAPGRGATISVLDILDTWLLFQFTHPGGVRRVHLASPISYACFNSRTREGCDKINSVVAIVLVRFNSRTREGCDLQGLPAFLLIEEVSIHAPGRGATASALSISPSPESFNSRTREGCDEGFYRLPPLSTVSIHAPGRGATFRSIRLWLLLISFNSRTREGCDSTILRPALAKC